MLSASSAQTSCCWTSHLQHADSYMLLVSLSCDARTSHVRPSSRKYLQVQSSCRTKLTLCLWVGAPPVKATLPQLHHPALLMLQELSAKWQMAASQRGYCEFRAGSLWKHSHCRSYWLTQGSLWGCRRCQGSPSPIAASLPHFLFQATERNPAH